MEQVRLSLCEHHPRHGLDSNHLSLFFGVRYQNNIKITMFVLFLIMYSIVVNNRTDLPTVVEWGVYVFVCGYIFEEFRLVSTLTPSCKPIQIPT